MVPNDFSGVELRRPALGAAPMAEKVGSFIPSGKPSGELRASDNRHLLMPPD